MPVHTVLVPFAHLDPAGQAEHDVLSAVDHVVPAHAVLIPPLQLEPAGQLEHTPRFAADHEVPAHATHAPPPSEGANPAWHSATGVHEDEAPSQRQQSRHQAYTLPGTVLLRTSALPELPSQYVLEGLPSPHTAPRQPSGGAVPDIDGGSTEQS